MTDPLDQTWTDGQSGGTPLSAARLTATVAAINRGISAADAAQATANAAARHCHPRLRRSHA